MSNILKKALFLDRDGVINIEKNYLYKIEDFEFMSGIMEVCKYYLDLGYIIVVVTNQSGIARGYYTQQDFDKLTSWMLLEFSTKNINITKVYYCPHHPDINKKCLCRKPEPGMLLDAKKEFNIDMKNSIMIGDKERDIEAALNSGLSETYLLDVEKNSISSKATKIVNSLNEIWK